MEYTRETLIKRLGEYVGILPSELHDIACEAVELLERFDCSKGIRLINLDDAIEIISDQQDGSGTTYEILSHIIRDILLLPIFETEQPHCGDLNSEWIPCSDLISRTEAIEAVRERKILAIKDSLQTEKWYEAINEVLEILYALPSADAEWIPCSERLPSELEAVIVTWVNHNPPVYYQYAKDIPLTDTAVWYDGKWYWWDATVIDLLGEYGGAYIHGIEPIDKDIEVLAWMPLPKPYREDGEI